MSLTKIIIPTIFALSMPMICDASAISFLEPSNDTEYNYVGIKAGISKPNNISGNSDLQSVSNDPSYAMGVLIGRKFMDRFGVEFEYMNRGKDKIKNSANATNNNWSVSSNTFMINIVADLITTDPRYYVKFGCGNSINNAGQYIYNDTTGSKTWLGKTVNEFAWQAGVGVNLATSKMIDTNIEYAYIDHGKFKTKSGSTFVGKGLTEADSLDASKIGYLREQVVTIGMKIRF